MEKQVNYLLDTNVWLERLLDQDNSGVVKSLLELLPSNQLFLSDFTLHSIGVILFRENKKKLFQLFIKDVFEHGRVRMLSLNPIEQILVSDVSTTTKLDFDDAYQHCIAERFSLQIITFDKDFKKGVVKFTSPQQVVQLYNR